MGKDLLAEWISPRPLTSSAAFSAKIRLIARRKSQIWIGSKFALRTSTSAAMSALLHGENYTPKKKGFMGLIFAFRAKITSNLDKILAIALRI